MENARRKILIAINDINLSDHIMSRLNNDGYITDSVVSGNDVIGKLKQMKPDLLLIDIKLPDKTGYEVLNEKSFDRDVTKIPVIIISNSGETVYMKKIPGTPTIKDYLISPHINAELLVDKIEKVFNLA